MYELLEKTEGYHKLGGQGVCGCLWRQNPKGSKMKNSDFHVQDFQIGEPIQ